jgi:hypothetical protein
MEAHYKVMFSTIMDSQTPPEPVENAFKID